jgi:flagellar basal body-associated protein FliL
MKKKGDSEIIAIVLLIMIVIFIMTLLIIFVMRFMNEQEEQIRLQNEIQEGDLDIDDIEFDSSDNQKMTLVLSKGQGAQILVNLSNQTYSYNVTYVNRIINSTWVLNSTLINVTNSTMVNITNSTEVNVTNSTIIMVENSTIINGSDADIITVNDVSGSMREGYGGVPGDKMSESKQANREFIDSILNETENQFGLVAYREYVRDSWGHPLTNDPGILNDRIDLWSANGNTCICCGILRATEYLSLSTRTKVMVVMTDGVTNTGCYSWSPNLIPYHRSGSRWYCSNSGGDHCDDMAYAAQRAFEDYGIIVYTVGFGDSSYLDEFSLRETARLGNGSYFFANVGNLSEIYSQIQQNITTLVPVNISFNQTINVSWNQTVNQTWIEEVNISWTDNVNVTWWEQINETIEENVTVEVFESQEVYSTLKVVFFTDSETYTKFMNLSDLPSPLETKEVEIDLSDLPITTDDVEKVEIYSVIYREDKEIISSQPIAVWEKPSLYSIFRFWN